MTTYIVEGQYDLLPYAKKWALPGTFPRRYWDVIEAKDEEELAAYLAGQQPYISDNRSFEPIPYGQEVKRGIRTRTEFEPSAAMPQIQHTCARCGRACKKPYKHCYRCFSYLKVKAKIA